MNEGVTEIVIEDDTSEGLQGSLRVGCGTASHGHCSLLRLYVMFIFMWQSTFRLSDAGTDVLFAFIASFLLIVSVKLGCEKLREFCQTLPRNIAAARKVTGQEKEPFQRWVCCPKCHSLYTLQQAKVVETRGKTVSTQCRYIRFPEHPQMRFRQPCGTVLLKSVRSPHGSTSLQPRLLYCYNSLIKAIGEMLKRPKFLAKCEQWRSSFSANPSMVYCDVYDGRIWREFQEIDGHPFLALPYNFCLTLNVDWFQLFKRSAHSVGVMYLAIQNLPRKERFLSENVIVVGVIPGPNEPKKHINTFLGPLVDELLQLWEGVIMKVSNESSVLIRAALTCVAYDIPATRKVCGFLGHNAALGCSVCLKKFPTRAFGEQADFSGFDRTEWTPRDIEVHRKKAIDYTQCKTRSAQIDIQREHGIHYSLLQELRYFNPIRMTVVDPMHNLLLGTAKCMMTLWTEQKIITKQQLALIQSNVDSFVTPNDVGRIPHKIVSGFSGFTAEQWKNWTIIFSLSSLKGILPREHFQCWHIFVKACHLCRRSITKQQVEEAGTLLLSFCTHFQQLYGKKSCTINHLHGHLASCILDHGPVYSFWLFAFERLNGVMEAFHTNAHNISAQLMRRFLDIHTNGTLHWPQEYQQQFSPLIEKHRFNKGSLSQTSVESGVHTTKPIPPLIETTLEPHLMDYLTECLQDTIPGEITVLPLIRSVLLFLWIVTFLDQNKVATLLHPLLWHTNHQTQQILELLKYSSSSGVMF